MSKIAIEDVEAVLLEKKIDNTVVRDIIKRLNQEIEEEKLENAESKEPHHKKRPALVQDGSNLFLIELTDQHDSSCVLEDLPKAIATHNSLPKNKKKKISSISEAFERLKPETLKTVRFKRKNKLPLEVIVVNWLPDSGKSDSTTNNN